uniref:Uncharacterized protein n=1 Tax=Podoviridae sp. ctiVc2 TaxID=2827745 RepID=A0A8S5S9V8_9CAUD|nr:MAG TPA: hypothetical protein [Podoviridae sp. ctiVc2]
MNDKQFTDELFRRMYDLGYRKAEIENGTVFFYKNCGRISQWSDRVDMRSTCFTEENQRIDIAEYLGIVDWSKVKVDTPILVRNSNQKPWIKRYFASFKNDKVVTWDCGSTSWSNGDINETSEWMYAKLAEV